MVAKQDIKDKVNLIMAAKSTPSLIRALKKDNKSRTTVNVNMNMFNTQQVGASTTMDSNLDSQRFDKPAKNLNVSSHEDLDYVNPIIDDSNQKPVVKEKVRPMTTRFGDRRHTQQPEMFQKQEVVEQNH